MFIIIFLPFILEFYIILKSISSPSSIASQDDLISCIRYLLWTFCFKISFAKRACRQHKPQSPNALARTDYALRAAGGEDRRRKKWNFAGPFGRLLRGGPLVLDFTEIPSFFRWSILGNREMKTAQCPQRAIRHLPSLERGTLTGMAGKWGWK